MFKKYIESRIDSLSAWIGVICVVGEVFLHRDPSTLMFCFFAALIMFPEAHFRELFGRWKPEVLKRM